MPTSNLGSDIKAGLKSVGGEWKRAKKHSSDKNDRVSRSRLSSFRYYEPKKTLREVAFKYMRQAYNKASSDGKYYANARQIMYAARPMILAELGTSAWNNNSDIYFTQTLLKDYIEDWGSHDMKVVWDARGHLREPHTEKEIGLGGAEVMEYSQEQIRKIEDEIIRFGRQAKTSGPANRYGAILFIEKEGFDIQLDDAGLADKWDIAIMSSKGIPNAATCNLGADLGVPVLAFHDFDLAGFKIVRTLRYGARLARGIHGRLIDIGLRLEDVEGIEPEPVDYKQKEDPRYYLRTCGATEDECDFLVTSGDRWNRWTGQRVEINMFTTEELIELLERKFTEHGIKKIIPDEETLRKTYRRAILGQALEKHAREIQEKQDSEIAIPDNLVQAVQESLDDDPDQSWDEAIWDMVEESGVTDD